MRSLAILPLLLASSSSSSRIIPSSFGLRARSAASPPLASAAFFLPPWRRQTPHRAAAAAVRPLASAATTSSTGNDDRDTSDHRRDDDDDYYDAGTPPTTPPSPPPASSSSSTTTSSFWRARGGDCWRPDVRDVERISWGMPAKKKGTGSRGVPHRLNDDERKSFDRARRDGFLQVAGSAYRSQRRDAPLLNSYRSLMDARGRPMAVLHKLVPTNDEDEHHDRLVVDLSPLRLPEEFRVVGGELRDRVLADFGVEVQMNEAEIVESASDAIVLDGDASEAGDGDDNDDDDWGTRPIYQLSPHYLSWGVNRQQGKQIGKYLGILFDTLEDRGHDTKTKPKGVKPGKGRRHGGYGIG